MAKVKDPTGKEHSVPEADVAAFEAKEGWSIVSKGKAKKEEPKEQDELGTLDPKACRALLKKNDIKFFSGASHDKLLDLIKDNNLN